MSDLFVRIRRSRRCSSVASRDTASRGAWVSLPSLDISLAIDSATFGFSEVRLGVVPAIISVVCLPKMRLAARRARSCADSASAPDEAADSGLITACVAASELDDAKSPAS